MRLKIRWNDTIGTGSMGTDIHAIIEHRTPGYSYWNAHGGLFNPGRDYILFDLLVGIRNDTSIVQPKGLPKDIGFEAHNEYYLQVVDDEVDELSYRYVRRSEAVSWELSGCTEILKENNLERCKDPDVHSPSYLTLEELKQIFTQTEAGMEYKAIMAAMEVLEDCRQEVRLVFWFDS